LGDLSPFVILFMPLTSPMTCIKIKNACLGAFKAGFLGLQNAKVELKTGEVCLNRGLPRISQITRIF
jgi:hypothetical protein